MPPLIILQTKFLGPFQNFWEIYKLSKRQVVNKRKNACVGHVLFLNFASISALVFSNFSIKVKICTLLFIQTLKQESSVMDWEPFALDLDPLFKKVQNFRFDLENMVVN
jgi:hypothetical protein